MHIKRMHEMIEKLTKCAEMELEKGVENINAEEMGEVIDMIKDLSEAEYYSKISKAMDESEYGIEYDYKGAYDGHERKGYKGQPRDSKGRYMRRMGYEVYSMTPEMYREHEPEYYRDMDMEQGRMYYTENMMEDNMHHGMKHSESRYDKARKGYEETKAMHNSGSAEDKKKAMESLENYMKELSEDMTELISKMDSSEKNMIRNKLQMLAQKVQ